MLCSTRRLFIKPMPSPHYAKDDGVYYALVDKLSGEDVGYICFQSLEFDEGTASLAYRTYSNYKEKGFMKEALPVTVNEVFSVLPINALTIEIRKENIASLNTIKCLSPLIEKKSLDKKYYKYEKRKGV